MRFAAWTLVGSLALAAAASANAAPAIPQIDRQQSANLIEVAGGCGPAFHRDGWGYCVPNRYVYNGWYGRPYYGGGYYHPHWRHWYGY